MSRALPLVIVAAAGTVSPRIAKHLVVELHGGTITAGPKWGDLKKEDTRD